MPDSATKHLILNAASYAALVLGVLALLYWAWFVARRPRRYCPGQPRPFSAWFWPFTWATFPQCGYDLASLTETGGLCRCPECGRESRIHQRRQTPTSIAWRRLGVLFLVAGVSAPVGLYLRSGRWATHLPTPVLLAVRSTMGSFTHPAVRDVIMDRCRPPYTEKGEQNGEPPLPLWQQRWAIRTFINDLRDDDVPYNAEGSLYALSWFAHDLTNPPLQAALRSDDYQQRQYAADILRDRSEVAPSADLYRVSVEGLVDDSPGDGRTSWLLMSNAHVGFDYLLLHAEGAEPYIKEGLASKDAQQRMLCALIAAATNRQQLLPTACPLLVESLGSDDIEENAKFSAAALMKLGRPALPYLKPALADDDAQRRQIAVLLVQRIEEPLSPPTRLLESDAASITGLVSEPSLLRLESIEHHFWSFRSINATAGTH